MKHRFLSTWRLLAVLALLLVAAAPSRSGSNPSPDPQPGLPSDSLAAPAASPLPAADSLSTDQPADADISSAPVTPLSRGTSLPPTIRPSSPVAEVVKLANSGLDQTVLLAFVTNSTSTFNLDADKIIYLNDIGVPAGVVTAMIQRDQEIKAYSDAAAAAAAAQPPAPMPPYPDPAVATGPVEAPLTPPDDVTDATFYDSLAPYGNWVDVGGYGPCWQPSVVVVNPGWQPYFDCGHWLYSDCGWYWSSDYSWGWAPFHYGRWFRHSNLGWCWRPDRVWGPSWVCWRHSDDFCGWAPLPPSAGFTLAFGLTFHGRRAASDCDFGLRADHFHFVAWHNFSDRRLRNFALAPRQSNRIFNQTLPSVAITAQQGRIVNRGLPPERVAAATHAPVRQVTLPDFNRAGSGVASGTPFRPNHGNFAGVTPRPAGETPPQLFGTRTANPGTPATPSPGGFAALRNLNPPAHPEPSSPLIYRGRDQVWPPNSPPKERTPANSLVVIGGRDNANPQPWTPPRPADPPARADRPQPAYRPDTSRPFYGFEVPHAAPSTLPAPMPARNIAPEVPRYTPAPTFSRPAYQPAPAMPSAPRQTYSEAPHYSQPPVISAPSHSAPSAPAASPSGGSSRR
ncbi:MAG TPA: DUF6600 domain-containing protein [Candidatus Binatia bacterium]|jgi:hypothetical protein|nr:DUF6600 domain-containing protein [Candidatus Binatia bacterium]